MFSRGKRIWHDLTDSGYVDMGMGEKWQIQGTTYIHSIACCFKGRNVPCLFLGRAVTAWPAQPWDETMAPLMVDCNPSYIEM
jgi:hypothetical protein